MAAVIAAMYLTGAFGGNGGGYGKWEPPNYDDFWFLVIGVLVAVGILLIAMLVTV